MNHHRRTIVILGMMGRTPFAGVAWQVLQYLEGLHRLGHEVYYVEDTGDWPYDAAQQTITSDSRYTVNYLGRLMDWCSLADRWAYLSVAEGRKAFGPLSETALAQLFDRADALINLTASTILRDEHLRVPVRIYLETDPVLPQIEVAQGRAFTIDLLAAHTHHFTFGENLGAADCGVPIERFRYLPTRQPVVLDWWGEPRGRNNRSPLRFSTIANWKQSGKDVEWNGERYTWSKHFEFLKFIDVATRAAGQIDLELALACDDAEAIALLRARGWQVTNALTLSQDPFRYRNYLCGSDGEFTVAKDQNVRLRSGWFSDRSACYLAAGLPVVTQDTAFDKALPTGEGLFSFRTVDDVLNAFTEIVPHYARHQRAAYEIAAEYFRAETVLAHMLERTGI